MLAGDSGLPTDGHEAGWVLGISHIQLYQRLYPSVGSQSLSFPLSPVLSLFLSCLGGRKIKVLCFLHEIFVSAFWVYLKIKLSLIHCLSLRLCEHEWQALLCAIAIIKLQMRLQIIHFICLFVKCVICSITTYRVDGYFVISWGHQMPDILRED